MNRTRRGGRVIAQPVFCALCALALFGAMTESRPASAQTPSGQRLSAEQQLNIWRLQAESVAAELALKQDEGAKLVAAYQEMRHARPEAIREASERRMARAQGGNAKNLSAFSTLRKDINEGERLKFKARLSAFLSDGKAERASQLLGAPEDGWDAFVNTLAGLGLDDEELYAALPALNVYGVGLSKVTEDFYGSFNERTKKLDFRTMADEERKLKRALDGALEPLLNREQTALWRNRTKIGVQAPAVYDGRLGALGGVTPRP